MTEIIELLRNLIQDNLLTDGRDTFTYESISSSKIFTLTESNIDSTTILVYKNGTLWSDTNYTFSTTTGKLTITGTLIAGDSLEVDYSYYQKYSSNELKGFIKSAVSYLAVEKYGTFKIGSDDIVFPTPTLAESNLIALIASILIKGDVTHYRTPEITINFEKSDSKEKKIYKIITQFKKTFGVLKFIKYDEKYVDEDEIGTL